MLFRVICSLVLVFILLGIVYLTSSKDSDDGDEVQTTSQPTNDDSAFKNLKID